MIKKPISDILNERIKILQEKLSSATSDREKLIYTELIEKTNKDLKQTKLRNIKKIVYRLLGSLMLILILIKGIVILKEYYQIEQYKSTIYEDNSIGSQLSQENNEVHRYD